MKQRHLFSYTLLFSLLLLNLACSKGAGYGDSSSYDYSSNDPGVSTPGLTPTTAQEIVADRVQKMFSAKCMSCHSAQVASGGVVLSSAATILAKGLVTPGNAAGSSLYQSLAANRMPLGSTLDAASKQDVQDWINQGSMEFPLNLPAATPTPGVSPTATPAVTPVVTPTATPVVTPTATPVVSPTPVVPTPTPTPAVDVIADRVQKLFVARCINCHSATVPSGGISNLTSAAAILQAGLVVKGNAAGSTIYQSVSANRMPLGSVLDDASKKDIQDWINQGAVEFPINRPAASPTPTPVGATPTPTPTPTPVANVSLDLEAAYTDLQTIAANTRPFIRYVTSSHAYNSASILPTQKSLFLQGVTKVLNSLHWRPALGTPTVVNTQNTVMRIDLRQFDLSANEWAQITSAYPYLRTLEASNRWATLKSQTRSEVPVVRGDWLIQEVLQPDLYKQLLELPDNVSQLEERIGVNAEQNIRASRVIRAGVLDSGVSFSNRVIERHDSRFGAYWKSYDFETSRGDQNIFRNPLGPVLNNFSQDIGFVHNGGEMIFTLPNGMHGYVLTNATGDYLPEAPDTIVQDPTREDHLVVNGNSCFTCHTVGWIPIQDEVGVAAKASNRFNRNQLGVINKLYVPNTALAATFSKDVAAYVATLGQMKISTSAGEPVSTANLYYARDLQINDIAAELEISAADLMKYLTASSNLRAQFSFANNRRIDVATVTSSRVRFEQRYNAILQELARLKRP